MTATPHYPSKSTITLASLVKGRWIDGKAQTVALLLSACDMPTIFILQTFLPSRRRDCRTTIPRPAPNSQKNTKNPPFAINSGFFIFNSQHLLKWCPVVKHNALTAPTSLHRNRHILNYCFLCRPPFRHAQPTSNISKGGT